MSKSAIIGCNGEVVFCKRDDIDFLSFVMGKMVEDVLIEGKLESIEYLTRVCNISIKGNITTLKTELVGNQMREAQEYFEKIGYLALNVKDLNVLKKRVALIEEVARIYKKAEFMQEKGYTEYQGETIEELGNKSEDGGNEIENNKLSIEFDVDKNEGEQDDTSL